MVAGAKAKTWAEFMKEAESIEMAKKSAQGCILGANAAIIPHTEK